MSDLFWIIEVFIEVCGGMGKGDLLEVVIGILIDSWILELGDVYIVIKGDWFDGYDFVEVVLEVGVFLVLVVEYCFKDFLDDGWYVSVVDFLDGM